MHFEKRAKEYVSWFDPELRSFGVFLAIFGAAICYGIGTAIMQAIGITP